MVTVFCFGEYSDNGIGLGILINDNGIKKEFAFPVYSGNKNDVGLMAIEKALQILNKRSDDILLLSYSAYELDASLGSSKEESTKNLVEYIKVMLEEFKKIQVREINGSIFKEEMQKVDYLANQAILLLRSSVYFDKNN